jgi:WD40 repeat protein
MKAVMMPCVGFWLLLPAVVGCAAIDFPGHLPRSSALLQENNVSAVEISPDGKMVATAEYTCHWFRGADVSIELWDCASGHRRGFIPCAHPGETIQCLAWSPDSKRLAYVASGAGGAGRIIILNAATGLVEQSFPESETLRTQIAFTQDGHRLSSLTVRSPGVIPIPFSNASDCYPLEFQVRDVVSSQTLETFRAVAAYGRAALSASGETIAWHDTARKCPGLRTLGAGTVMLEDFGKTGKRLVCGMSISSRGDLLLLYTSPRSLLYRGQIDRLSVVAIPGGQVLHDGEYNPYKPSLPSFGEQTPRLIPTTGRGEVRISGDCRTVVTVDSGGSVKFWNAQELLEKRAQSDRR